ncbi:MAG: phage tail tape measure protein [Paraclostridium sp.]
MADGKVVVETGLDSSGIEKDIDGLGKSFESLGKNSGLDTLGDLFDALGSKSSLFGKTFGIASKLVSSSAATAIAGIATLVVGFLKLYEASKKNFVESLQKIGKTLEPIIDIVKRLGQEMLTVFSNVTGFEFSFSSLITEAIEFESAMASVAAVMGVTGDGITQITMTAREFGATTRYSAIQIADAFSFMGMAGWSAQESIDGMSAVLNVATIGATDLGVASDIVTDSLTALQMSASQAGNFVDMLSATITSSNTNVEMFGETMKYVGSVAGSLGVSMSDLSVATALMADSGIKASNAGTSLRTLLTNLTAPTDTVAKAMNKYGIEAIYASDGSLDLNETLVDLRKSLKALPLKEQTEAAKALAGKTGMAGLLSIVNATDEKFNELTDTINNSTETVDYWNENCALTGKVGQEATDAINMMKDAFDGAEATASGLNLTTQDLALAVQLLGADADVTSGNVEDLLNVFSTMRAPTEQQAEIMKELGITYRETGDDLFDYSKTLSMVDSSITGLSRAQKEQIKSQLSSNMTLEEANEVLKQYDMTARTTSTGQIDMIANLRELRSTFKDMDEATLNATLQQLGLGSAIEEVNEVMALSDDEFELYCSNIELAIGLSEKLASAMDETTKNSLLSLSSALTDIGLFAFEKLKQGINDTSKVLNDFLATWRGEDFSYTFANFKLACDDLLDTVRNMDLSGAMSQALNGLNTFISGGGLGSILAIGGEIISQIAQGIIQNKGTIEEGISSAIQQIATWVSNHAGEIGQAGKVILEAIRKGIEDNTSSIRLAMDSVASVMNDWISSSNQIKSMAGEFADIFISSFSEQLLSKITGKAGELWSGFWSFFIQGGENSHPDWSPIFGEDSFFGKIGDWLFPKAYADGVETIDFYKDGAVVGVDKNGQYIYDKTMELGRNASDGIVEGAQEGVLPLNELMRLEEATTVLQQSATNMYNGAKVSFSKLADVGKESMTSMYLGMQGSLVAAENSVKTSATNMYLGASQSFNALRDAGTTSMISLNNVIRTQISEARNTFTSQMMSMEAVARTQAGKVRDAITTQFISIQSVIRTQITEARNTFTSQMMSMEAVARTQAGKVRDGITTQFISIKNVIRTQITEARNAFTSQMMSMAAVARTQSNAITSAFRSCASQMYSIGVQMGAGLRNGLASQSASIIATANSIANNVAKTMRQALDIHSPSRVTAEIGSYAIQGLEVGMNAEQLSLYGSVESNMAELYGRMRGAVDSSIMSTSRAFSAGNIRSSQQSSNKNESNESIDRLINALENHQSVVVTTIDGKTVAKTSAPFMNTEIKGIDYINARKRGDI